MCTFVENEDKLFWFEITNFDQIKKKNAGLVMLWIRNDEYLYTRITGGADLK